MAESDGSWGELVAQGDSELGDAWDALSRLPDPGENIALDAFCERKNLDIPALMRMGAKLSEHTVLAFAFPGGIKYRDMITDRRWNYYGSEFTRLKIVPNSDVPSDVVIICEGETDGARLTMLFDVDVAVMPAGARYFPQTYADQVAGYARVLIALDKDKAGDDGAEKISALLPYAERFPAPGEGDWADVLEAPALPPEPERQDDVPMMVTAEQLLGLEVPEVASWFEHALLPIGGLLILHGWAKSFKTFLALDMLSALAQGQDWACFEPTEEPCKVAVVQYELTWPYYRERIAALSSHAREPELFAANFLSYSPMARPRFRAGNDKEESALLRELTEAGVQVMLLDPIRRATGTVDMNDEAEVRRLLGFFERLNNEGITVIATHHDNKTSAKAGGGDPTGMTGSGAWAGDPDSIVSVELPKGEKLTESTKRNLIFTLRNAPILTPRGMEIRDDGSILYSNEPHGDWGDDSTDAPSI